MFETSHVFFLMTLQQFLFFALNWSDPESSEAAFPSHCFHWIHSFTVFVSRCCGCKCEISRSSLCCERIDRHPPLHLHTTEVSHVGWKRSFDRNQQSPLVSEFFNLSRPYSVCVWQRLREQQSSLQISGRQEGKLHFTDHRHSVARWHHVSLQNGS